VLHSCRCIVFGCLDSNPGLNSNVFACFKEEIEIKKRSYLPGLLSSRFRRGPIPGSPLAAPHFSPASVRTSQLSPARSAAQLSLAARSAQPRARRRSRRGRPLSLTCGTRTSSLSSRRVQRGLPAPPPIPPRARLPS
jgi:hypothetical protein